MPDFLRPSVRLYCRSSFVWMSLLLLPAVTASAQADDSESLGLKVPPGFEITRYADDALAHDIYSMTIDTAGRVVVSGPGYVRILVDSDNDGKADRAKEFVDGPRTGAQGLYFLGRDLLCTGDEGLIRYKDENGDDKADGPPETFLKIKTGSEHHAHAIRRGPDGWWYVIAGNFAEISAGYITEKNSPIKSPHGGVIMRLRPDMSGGEVFCDGFRNAYDFDFDARGEVVAHDSDSERDVSLPWYLPSRLFLVLPAGEHGWITESWLRPDYFIDSAPVIASTGRGSPTGVTCYRHTQFPEKYRGALFVEDWTFGKVAMVPAVREGASFARQEPVDFITTIGETGFAPTDIEVGMDGSLYVCVGGRGTHGTVYRVTWKGDEKSEDEAVSKPALFTVTEQSSHDQKLKACLEAPQPLSSWSRARWVPLATKLGAQAFLSVALDEQQPAAFRIRAVEILTDLFNGLPATAAEILATAKSPELRARAVWALGTRPSADVRPDVLVPYLNDTDAVVRRCGLEAAARIAGDQEILLSSIARCLNDNDRVVRLTAARLLPALKANQVKQVADATRQMGWKAAVATTMGYVWRSYAQNQSFNAYAVDIGRRVLLAKHPVELKLEAVRLLQMALGDLGGREDTTAVFDGYVSSQDLSKYERDLDSLRITISDAFPTGERLLDLELARLAAMLTPLNDKLFDKVLAKITAESSPIDDLHYLIVAARMPVIPGGKQQETLALALLGLDQKITRDRLGQDSHWNDRVGEMYAALCSRAEELPLEIVQRPEFGRPAHVLLMTRLDEKSLPLAVDAFTKAVKARPDDYPWNNDVVFVVGRGRTPEHHNLLRAQWERYDLRMAILMVLAEKPEEQDREKFLSGLEMSAVEILTTSVAALEFLPAKKDPVTITALVKLLRRLGAGKNEFALREKVVKLLEKTTREKYDFVFGQAGHVPQTESIEKWTAYVTKNFPEEAARQFGSGEADLETLRTRLAKIDWEGGSVQKGRTLYNSRCAQCHGGSNSLGPDLAGIGSRFSRDDLFVAIAIPNRDVSSRYQTTLIETKAGKIYTGLIVYESVDGVLLRNGTNQNFRIEGPDIESKRTLTTSLMPEGLLKDLSDADLADLYAYLKTLAARTAQAARNDDEETETE